jgi:hypothetical protein
MHSVSTCLLGLVVATAANLAAQSVPDFGGTDAANTRLAAPNLVAPPVGFQANTGFHRQGDTLRAGGRDYELVFAEGEVEFVPALGARAPRTMPLRLGLQSIERGGVRVHDAAALPAPAVVQHGARVSFARGDTIAERYDVGVEGVEQSLAFAVPLPGSGDLVARFAVTTDLLPTTRPDGSLYFALEGVGGVAFGTVTGVDADGRRCAGSLRLDGRTLDLVLPAAFVDGASYPLVLDPLIGTEFDLLGGNSGFSDTQPDVAYDFTNDKWLVVWRRVFSNVDSGVRAQRLNGSGSLAGSTLFLTVETSHKTHLRVCNVNATDRFLVAWEQSVVPVGPRNVRGLVVDAATGSATAAIDLVATADDEYGPCLMGEATTGDDEAVLLWQDGGGIKVRQVTVGAAGDPVPVGAVATLAIGNVRAGNLGKSTGSGARTAAVWVDANGADAEIVVQGVTKDAAPIGVPVAVTNNGRPDDNPAVDGNGSQFLVVWQQAETGNPPFDVRGRPVTITAAAAALTGTERSIDPVVGANQVTPDVCWLGSKYGVFWVREIAGFVDDVEGYLVNADCTVCGIRLVLDGVSGAGNYDYEFLPRCCGRVSGNPVTGDDGLVVFGEAQTVAPFESNLIAQRFEALGPGVAPVVLGPGCGAGGTAGTTGGPFVVGNPSFRFTLTGIPASVAPFFSIGFPTPPTSCGSCTLTAPLSFEFLVNSGGAANKPLPVPCSNSFNGVAFEVQWVTFLTSGNGCPSAPGLSATQRVRHTIGL